jgi:hypothetical protein
MIFITNVESDNSKGINTPQTWSVLILFKKEVFICKRHLQVSEHFALSKDLLAVFELRM